MSKGLPRSLSRSDAAKLAKITDNSGGTASDTIAAITAGAAYAQADATAIKNAIASLNAKLNAVLEALK
jgi:hypothetical protein